VKHSRRSPHARARLGEILSVDEFIVRIARHRGGQQRQPPRNAARPSTLMRRGRARIKPPEETDQHSAEHAGHRHIAPQPRVRTAFGRQIRLRAVLIAGRRHRRSSSNGCDEADPHARAFGAGLGALNTLLVMLRRCTRSVALVVAVARSQDSVV